MLVLRRTSRVSLPWRAPGQCLVYRPSGRGCSFCRGRLEQSCFGTALFVAHVRQFASFSQGLVRSICAASAALKFSL